MSPKVSVVIPVYNASAYLPQCLDTILLQTLMDIEVICVNDGSTDNSSEVLAAYTQMDERLKVIHQENAGAAVARNRGMKEATGEYIIFLDADDFFAADMLEKMLAAAQKDQSDVVVCGYYIFDSVKQQCLRAVLPSLPEKVASPFAPADCPEKLFTFMSPNAWTKLVRTDFIKKEGILFDDQPYCNDLFFTCSALALARKISVIPAPFIFYRVNTKTQISFNKTKNILPLLSTFSRLYDTLKDKGVKNFEHNYFDRLMVNLYYELGHRSRKTQVESLMSIRKMLPPEIIHQFFLTGERPAVSIIVPVYNAAKFLPECLDSCIHQTLEDIEIICVDDGSTDNSLDILQQYARRDKRIKIITQENQGLPISRNNAMSIAAGKYIQFLDSDDYLDTKACECLYFYAEIFGLDMLFFTAVDFQDETKELVDIPYHNLTWLPEDFIPVFTWQNVKEVIMGVAVTACLTFYKHDFLKENNIHWINQRLCYEDSPFFIESFFKAKRVGALKEPFYQRRVHGAAITQNMANNFPDYCKICRMTLKIAKQYADDEAFLHLFYGYTQKVYANYLPLPASAKIKFVHTLLALYNDLKNEYGLPLSDEIEERFKTVSNPCPVRGKYKIAILYIATGKYIDFWKKFYKATEKYFLPEHEKTYFLFTDHQDLDLPKNVVPVHIENEVWPYITLKRYHYFCDQKETLKKFDYLYFMNANLIFQAPIGNEVLPSSEQGLMVTIHPWYLSVQRERFTYETNQRSKAYIAPNEGRYYFMGSFNGGTSQAFLKLAEKIKEWTDIDLTNNVIPLWHDESMLNRYMIDYMNKKNPLVLLPEYVVPGDMNLKYEGIKGILLDKKRELGMDYLRQIKKYD